MMSVLYGATQQMVVKHTPYRIYNALLSHEKTPPFSNGKKWFTFNGKIIEMLEIIVSAELSHRGVFLKSLATRNAFSFFDTLPEESRVTELLNSYNIDETASLSLDIRVTLTKGFYLPNPDPRSRVTLLNFSRHKSAETIHDPYYMVAPETPTQTADYFSAAEYFSKPSEKEKIAIEKGPGVLLNNDENVVHNALHWQSCLGEAYDSHVLKDKLKLFIAGQFPEYQLAQSNDPKYLVNDYNAENPERLSAME